MLVSLYKKSLHQEPNDQSLSRIKVRRKKKTPKLEQGTKIAEPEFRQVIFSSAQSASCNLEVEKI